MENKESFYARIEPFFSGAEEYKIKLAYILSKAGHRDQFRKELVDGQPMRYFEHLRRVALILMDEAHCMRSEMIIAALCHDILEDSQIVSVELLEYTFGPEVSSIVKKLSKMPKEGYIERLMICTDWRTLLIKACDRLDNLRSLMVPGTSVSFQEKQVAETREKYLPLFQKMLKLVPPEHFEGAMRVRDEILITVERCSAVLDYNKINLKDKI